MTHFRNLLLSLAVFFALALPLGAQASAYGCQVTSRISGSGKYESIRVTVRATSVPSRGALSVYLSGTPYEDGYHATLDAVGERDTFFVEPESPVSVTVTDPQGNTVCSAFMSGKG